MIPAAVGGALDTVARSISTQLHDRTGQPVIVEAKPGGNGVVAVNSARDYRAGNPTAMYAISSFVQNIAFKRVNAYQIADFSPLCLVAEHPIAYAVHKKLGVRSLAEFITLAKSRSQGEISYGTWGVGSAAHLYGEMLNKDEKIRLLHVPFQGEAPAMQALMGGDISSLYASAGTLARLRSSGAYEILAITGSERLASFPDIPTFSEQGHENIGNLSGWSGVLVSARMPAALQGQIARILEPVIQSEATKKTVLAAGYQPKFMGPQQFSAFIEAEMRRWTTVLRDYPVDLG
ncbi:MAG: tripartite tricarboxylate transporter substrate binding protein [Comamonas sp.]